MWLDNFSALLNWFKRKDKSDSDTSLLSDARAGDQEALGHLFNRYVELLYGVALKYHKDSAKAEDAVMEIYEKCQQKINTHEINDFRPWLYVLAKNHCLEQLRKEKRTKEKKDEYQFVQSADVFHPYSEDSKESQLITLEGCIETLKDEQKTMIQLFYLEQRSYKEISEKLSMKWEKVRSHIQNGRRNLKKCMEAK